MAQRVINGEQYEAFLIRGDLDGGPVPVVQGFSIPEHDYAFLSYTGGNLTGVVYKLGGAWDGGSKIYSGGTTVGELELVYDGSNNLVQVVEV